MKRVLTMIAAAASLLLTCASTYCQEEKPAAASADTLAALQRAITQVEATADHSSLPYRTNLPLALLAVKKAQLLNGPNRFPLAPATALNDLVQEGLAALKRLEAGQMQRATPGNLTELAYVTANDCTVQPYYLYLPAGYTPRQKWPLIVFLHGYVPSISVLDPWILPPEVCDIAGRNGCMLLIPYGRRNTDFQGVGEVDVFASLKEVEDLYPVDLDRLYLSGASMGGMGTWNIALRHPGMFAAATPLCGQTDMFLWWGWPREEVPPFKRWLIEWDNAVDQAPNLYGQSFLVQHGEMDQLIPVAQSRLMVALAAKRKTPVKYHEFPGASHFIYLDTPCYVNAWSWQKSFRLDGHPRRIEFKAYSLEYNQAFWLTIDSFEHWWTPAQITAEVSEDRTSVDLTSENVAAIRLNIREAPLKGGQRPRVTWNGKPVTGQVADGYLAIPPPGLQTAGSSPWPPRKRKGLCGPCEEVFDTRFLVVQGTAGDAAADDDLARKVARWAQEWDDFADGAPLVKTDAEVTAEDLAKANLVLFGTPATNSILARIADKLPIRIGDHRYTVLGQECAGSDLGLVMCYPNPLSPSHYVLIYSGEWYGEKLSINHKHDLLPDFLVFTTKSFGRDDTNDYLCAGFFDMAWDLTPRLTWTAESPQKQ